MLFEECSGYTSWKNLTMTFYNKNKVVIRGDPSLTKTRVSLKSKMKIWTDFDQGFLIECRVLEGGMTLAELGWKIAKNQFLQCKQSLKMCLNDKKNYLHAGKLNITFI